VIGRRGLDYTSKVLRHLRRVVVLSLGWALIALGIVGLFLPVLQGVLLLMVGLYVLSRESRAARRTLRRILDRYPELDTRLKAGSARLHRLLERWGCVQPEEPTPGATAVDDPPSC